MKYNNTTLILTMIFCFIMIVCAEYLFRYLDKTRADQGVTDTYVDHIR